MIFGCAHSGGPRTVRDGGAPAIPTQGASKLGVPFLRGQTESDIGKRLSPDPLWVLPVNICAPRFDDQAEVRCTHLARGKIPIQEMEWKQFVPKELADTDVTEVDTAGPQLGGAAKAGT